MCGQQLGERIDHFLADEESALQALHRYYRSGMFAGRHFDTYGGGGLASPHRITAEDIVALSFLDVPTAHEASVQLVAEPDPEIEDLLRHLDPQRSTWHPQHWTLWDDDETVDRLLSPDGPAVALWNLLNQIGGFGDVRTNKLMARKRPQLFPPWDRVIHQALQPPTYDFWKPLRYALSEDDKRRVTRLGELRLKAGLGEHISLLRILDVVVWAKDR